MSDYAASDYLEELLCFVVTKGSAQADNLNWLALYTSNPTDADSGNEVSGGNYSRLPLNTSNMYRSGNVVKNKLLSPITFSEATANWGTITHLGVVSSSGAADLLLYGELDTPVEVKTNDTLQYPGQALQFTFQRGPLYPERNFGSCTSYFCNQVMDWIFLGGTLG